MARRQLELSNEVAAELAGSQDTILKTLEDHLAAQIFLRGNVVTLEGDAEAVQAAATGVGRLNDHLVFDITGGTGHFSNASGNGRLTGVGDVFYDGRPTIVTLELTGTITMQTHGAEPPLLCGADQSPPPLILAQEPCGVVLCSG